MDTTKRTLETCCWHTCRNPTGDGDHLFNGDRWDRRLVWLSRLYAARACRFTIGYHKCLDFDVSRRPPWIIDRFCWCSGGFIIVLALIFLLGLSIRHAIGTSLFIFAIKSLLGFAGDVMVVSGIQWTLLAKYIVVALDGIAIGVRLNKRVPAEKIKAGFGWTVLGVGIAILIREFP